MATALPWQERSAALTPEQIQREVEKAANKDRPVEAVFERRHEIRDESQQIKREPVASPVSGWQPQRTSTFRRPTSPDYGSLPSSYTTPAPQLSGSSRSEEKALYTKAIAAGFVVAVIVAIVIVMLVALK
jgi:uncharacterized protein YfaA (DUF2138 family)